MIEDIKSDVLRFAIREIPLAQGLVAIVDAADYEAVTAGPKWTAYKAGNTFYVYRSARRHDGRRTTQSLHSLITGWPLVDHINGDGLDNRRSNLREATHAENMRNRRHGRNNTSGFKGVSWHKGMDKWQARIKFDNRTRHFGYFATAEEAALAYDAAARELHGEFARLNFPDAVDHHPIG